MAAFPGFPPDFFRFFKQLKENNNREWFNDNKSRYLASVVEPMGVFISCMAPHLKRISPHYLADPRPNGGSMFRIYRDTRFSKDKTPYKTHAACHFRHVAGRTAHAPGFYAHFGPGELMFGGGVWQPDSQRLALIRAAIADNPAAWSKISKARAVKVRGGIQGERLQRPPKGYNPEHPHIEDLKLRSFYVMSAVEPKLARSPDLPREVAGAFRAAAPLSRFVCEALDLSF
jgi:uncharacterized protein (TIGR02453 family)